jgi:hypothetical protein
MGTNTPDRPAINTGVLAEGAAVIKLTNDKFMMGVGEETP